MPRFQNTIYNISGYLPFFSREAILRLGHFLKAECPVPGILPDGGMFKKPVPEKAIKALNAEDAEEVEGRGRIVCLG